MKQLYLVAKYNRVYQDTMFWIFTNKVYATAAAHTVINGDDTPVGGKTTISRAQVALFGLPTTLSNTVIPFTVTP